MKMVIEQIKFFTELKQIVRVTLLLTLGLFYSFSGKSQKPEFKADAAVYTRTMKKLTNVMVEDVTGPCAAARYYAYAGLAPYAILLQQAKPKKYSELYGRLKAFPDLSSVKPAKEIDLNFAALYALFRMGEELLPSGFTLEKPRNELINEAKLKYRISDETIRESRAYADSIVKRLVRYAAKDGYVKTSGYLRYTPGKKPGSWKPTPPAYTEAYEPHWRTLRPFLLESADQFKPLPEVPYSTEKDSKFFSLTKEVYDTVKVLTKEQMHIANFWDCNPFFLNQKGHISFGTKKISPGGHWIGITGLACQQKKLSFEETVRWHALVGITMADAFISCWDEKYRSNRIRPETVINEQIDPAWRSFLQTPPFPEYTSGHSVVSASVATLLTKLSGGGFAYTDTTEVEFGVPKRSFKSFKHAASEAAISRLYGGIHFRDAIENGMKQGENIGNYAISKLNVQ